MKLIIRVSFQVSFTRYSVVMFFYTGGRTRLLSSFDSLSKKIRFGGELRNFLEADWYANKIFLTMISPLCLCTNNVLLVMFSLLDEIELGFLFIVVIGNLYLFGLQGWKIFKPRNSFSV